MRPLKRLKLLIAVWSAGLMVRSWERLRTAKLQGEIARLDRDIDRLEERQARLERLRNEIGGIEQDLLLDTRLSAPRPDLIRSNEALEKRRLEYEVLSCVHERDKDRLVCRLKDAQRRQSIEERFGKKKGRLS